VRLAVKTRDLDTFDPRRPADLLLTTPESLDALLATKPKTLTHVAGVVLDELHVLDGGARGDQLRVLLNRLRQVRAFAAASGDAPDAQIQYVALSATLAEPAAVAARYFPAPQVVTPGGRNRQLELLPLDADSAGRAAGRRWATFRRARLAQGARLLQHARRGGSLCRRGAPRRLTLWRTGLRPLLQPGAPAPPRNRGAVRPGRRRALLCQQHAGTGHRHRLDRRGDADRRAGQRGGLCPAHRARRSPPADDPGDLLLSHAAGGGAAARAARRA
jgi:hypothetical protein